MPPTSVDLEIGWKQPVPHQPGYLATCRRRWSLRFNGSAIHGWLHPKLFLIAADDVRFALVFPTHEGAVEFTGLSRKNVKSIWRHCMRRGVVA